MCKSEISHVVLDMFKHYNRVGVPKLRLLEELTEKALIVPYVLRKVVQIISLYLEKYRLLSN